MRIAVVNWTDRKVGGAESYLDVVVPALRLSGHDLFVWHESSDASGGERISSMDAASACAAKVGLSEAVRALETWRPDVLFVHRLDDPASERRLLDVAPAVFFAHDYYGTCISGTKTFSFPVIQPCDRRFGAGCLVNYFPRRCGGLSAVTMVKRYRLQQTRLASLSRYRRIATFSAHMRQEYLKHDFEPDRVAVLPPVDPLEHVSVKTSAHRVEGGADIRLAFIGRIDRLKGCGHLVETLPIVARTLNRAVRLTVAGDGPDLQRCRRLAESLAGAEPRISVRFTGWLSRDGCATLLDESDVLVVPSLWPEPLGFVGIEAQRRGVPVAAHRVGGIPEWLEDGVTGALAPGNPPTREGLAEAIARCVMTGRTAASHAAFSAPTMERHLASLIPLLEGACDRGRLSGNVAAMAALSSGVTTP